MKIETQYSDIDFFRFSEKLIQKSNETQFMITKNNSLKVVFPYQPNQTIRMSLNGYKKLNAQYSFLSYNNSPVKKSLFSLPLTYMGFSGYLNPFTNEAQINKLIPFINLPYTICHEMAHQMGYASESECNFIGFLATVKNDDLYFKFSGYVSALDYCLYNWKRYNPKIYKELLKNVHRGILKNFKENKDFWTNYQTPVESGFKIFYDNYLKINQQKDGLENYNNVVNLLIGYYKNHLI